MKKFSQFVNDTSKVNKMQSIKLKGNEVFGYGASTKGNVSHSTFKLNRRNLVFILERDPNKYGLETQSRILSFQNLKGKV